MKIAIIGASGKVGRHVLNQALDRGWGVSAQTRNAHRLTGAGDAIRVVVGDPTSPDTLAALLAGQDAVVFTLGIYERGPTTLFSDVTRALLPAMAAAGIRRLVVVTGVGCGDTRGHGGFVYDRLIYPLFTRNRYRDKDRQEAMIRESNLDWTLVRPAPFGMSEKKAPLHVVTRITPETRLTRIEQEEVAAFIISCLADGSYIHEAPFIGHPK